MPAVFDRSKSGLAEIDSLKFKLGSAIFSKKRLQDFRRKDLLAMSSAFELFMSVIKYQGCLWMRP